jgi:predicted amino acid dehydrogenase
VKQIVSVSLGPKSDDYVFKGKFLGHHFYIRRFGTDGKLDDAEDLLLQWNDKADAVGLGHIQFLDSMGSGTLNKETQKLQKLASQLHIPVTTGKILRGVAHEWSLRHLQFQFGNNYFTNARVFFFSGMANSAIAKVMSEYTDNLTFGDPVIENGIPKFLNSIKDLELYAAGIHRVLQWIPSKRFSNAAIPLRLLNKSMLRQAVRKAHIVVVPYYNFFSYLEDYAVDDLKGKIVVTSTAYDDRVAFLKKRGVDVIIDTTPKIFEKVVGMSVLEAVILVALDLPQSRLRHDDVLELISEHKMDPRVVYPSGQPKRVNRFAYVIHPLSQEYLKKFKPIEILSDIVPGVMGTVEKIAAYAPPFTYSKVTGIKSPTGVEAQGWLIALGETPEQMQSHSPEFTTDRILEAAKIAKGLGAQIMGIGMLPKAMKDTSVDVAKHAVLPITTGNSYVASAALWAASDAVRRMGLIKVEKGKILNARTMVIGATGPVGAICARLLAKAFQDVHMVGRNIAKLLALQESIRKESPEVKLHVATRADKNLMDMDVIIAASSGAGKILDIMRVKPGCVITDVTRPLIFSREDAAKRPDVMVIQSGEILLPGINVEMNDIGLPPNTAYAGLAETIVLALEGRFESFTVGSDTEWEKVREIYRMGLKHGMQLAAISGVGGVFSDDDIARVKALVLKEMKKTKAH